MRLGPGPVFVLECRTSARRWQTYAIRAGVVLVLFAALWLVWDVGVRQNPNGFSIKQYAEVGESFYHAVAGTQLALILLAAPGAAAGAVCLDKMRGNLLHLLVTDLSDVEIVLGKLASRLLPVAGLVVASLPVLMIASLLGGLDPEAVAAAYLVMFGTGLFGCALALLLSVWGRKPHEVLLMTYMVQVAWLMAYPIWQMIDGALFGTGYAADWLKNLNPYVLIFAPYARVRANEWGDYALFFVVTAGLSALCALLAVLTVRPCVIREGAVATKSRPVVRKRRDVRLLDREPLVWYEKHRRKPSRWTRAVWGIFIVAALGGTSIGLFSLAATGRGGDELLVFSNMLQVSVGILLVTVGAVTVLADERVRGGLDVLLTTPVRSPAIVWAKWRAAFAPVPWLTFLPATAAAGAAAHNGNAGAWLPVVLLPALIFAYGAFAVSFGLFVAVAIPRVGRAIALAVGLYAFQCVAWPVLSIALTLGSSGGEKLGPAIGSPIYGGTILTLMAMEWNNMFVNDRWHDALGWAVGWVGVFAAGAVFFYLVSLVAFDNRLGRVPDAGLRRRVAPPRHTLIPTAEAVVG